MKHLRYYSDFRSRKGALCRIEIWQESGSVFVPKHITMAGNPVEIEWGEVNKLEPVHSSSATLNLISTSDREFIDLYTVDVDSVRLDIYRDKKLYWSGNIDPEIFEEPYSYKDRYVTTIAFSDFAVLDRKNWDGRGIFSIHKVVETCLAAAGFQYNGLTKHISTKIADASQPLTLDELFIVGENFYNEDDEPMTMREALDETLRPFALRLVQKNGRAYLYDLNAVHAQTAKKVTWAGTDATLETDVVYNNVKVTFSPYADGALIDGTLNHEDVLTDQPVGASGELINLYNGNDPIEGFRVVCGTKSESIGNLTLSNGAVPFRIDPEYSGNKEAGVMWGYRIGDEWRLNAPYSPFKSNYDSSPSYCKEIIRTPRRFIGRVSNSHKYRLRITMEVLFDVRYNPFEQAAIWNEEGNWDRLRNWCNYGYIPIQLTIHDSDGKAVKAYDNNSILRSQGYGPSYWGDWSSVPKDPTKNVAWLCFYDKQNRTSSTGFGGWQTNKQIIGWYPGALPSSFMVRADGQYITLPLVSGFIDMQVYSGLWQTDNDYESRYKDIWSRSRWLAYKNPKIEIVKANGLEIDKEDIEDTAWINKGAKEGLEIDTIFGTMPEAVPSARGLIFDAAGLAFDRFSRAGHTDRLERLLIGTVYSQYASRKHILSGTVELLPEFGVLTDGNEPGQYMLLNEVQHLARDESEIRMVQFEADNYEAIDYK